MPPARRKNPEEQLQQSIVAWARLRARTCPDLDVLYHPANGGLRSKSEAGRFKAGGVLPGVSDLHLPAHTTADTPGLWMELKAPEGGPTVTQIDWLRRMVYRGEHVAIVRTTGAAIMLLAWHLGRPDFLGDVNRRFEQLTLRTARSGVFSYRFYVPVQKTFDALQMTPEQGKAFLGWVVAYRPELLDPAAK